MSGDEYDWGASATVETAVVVHDALRAYPALLARREGGDEAAGREALEVARRLSAAGRTIVLFREEIEAGIDSVNTPYRTGLVMLRLTCALVGLAADPWDQRAQLSPAELDALVEQDGLGDWLIGMVQAVREAAE